LSKKGNVQKKKRGSKSKGGWPGKRNLRRTPRSEYTDPLHCGRRRVEKEKQGGKPELVPLGEEKEKRIFRRKGGMNLKMKRDQDHGGGGKWAISMVVAASDET